jgi:hypothetical protein
MMVSGSATERVDWRALWASGDLFRPVDRNINGLD